MTQDVKVDKLRLRMLKLCFQGSRQRHRVRSMGKSVRVQSDPLEVRREMVSKWLENKGSKRTMQRMHRMRIMLWDLMCFEVCKSFLKFLTRWTRTQTPLVAGPFAAKRADNTRSPFQIFTANIEHWNHWNINKSSNGITMYVTCEDHVCEYFSSILLPENVSGCTMCQIQREASALGRPDSWNMWVTWDKQFLCTLFPCEVAVRPFFFLKN